MVASPDAAEGFGKLHEVYLTSRRSECLESASVKRPKPVRQFAKSPRLHRPTRLSFGPFPTVISMTSVVSDSQIRPALVLAPAGNGRTYYWRNRAIKMMALRSLACRGLCASTVVAVARSGGRLARRGLSHLVQFGWTVRNSGLSTSATWHQGQLQEVSSTDALHARAGLCDHASVASCT